MKLLFLTMFAALLLASCAMVASQKDYQALDWQAVRAGDVAKTSSKWGVPKWISEVNTTGWEDSAFIYPDGQTLSFVYTNADLFAPGMPQSGPKRKSGLDSCEHIPCGVLPRGDFYVSKKRGNVWTEPSPHPLTLPWPIGGLHLNDNIAYVMQDRGEKADLYMAKKTNNGWSDLEELKVLNSKYSDEDPYVSPDNTQIFFWSDRPDQLKGHNLYYSSKKDGNWQKPSLLPAPINSNSNDMQPFVSGDDLYFASDRGDKRLRIYRTSIVDGEWEEPEIIVESKFGVGEPTFTADGKYMYFIQVFSTDGHFNPDVMFVKIRD